MIVLNLVHKFKFLNLLFGQNYNHLFYVPVFYSIEIYSYKLYAICFLIRWI